MKKTIVSLLAAAGSISTPAFATDGFAACMAISKDLGRSFFAEPVAADQAKTDALGMQFAQFLSDNKYTEDMYAPKDAPPPKLTVDCRWNSTSVGAAAWRDQVIPGTEARGFRVVRVVFKPQ